MYVDTELFLSLLNLLGTVFAILLAGIAIHTANHYDRKTNAQITRGRDSLKRIERTIDVHLFELKRRARDRPDPIVPNSDNITDHRREIIRVPRQADVRRDAAQIETPSRAPEHRPARPLPFPPPATGVDLQGLTVVVEQMEARLEHDGHTESALAALNQLHLIVTKEGQAKLGASPAFVHLLKRLVHQLLATDQGLTVISIDQLFPAVTQNSACLNKAILTFLAGRLLGMAPPGSPTDPDLELLGRHMAAARDLGQTPLAQFIWIVFNFTQGNHRAVEDTFRLVRQFDRRQVGAFLQVLHEYCRPASPTVEAGAVAANCEAFRDHQDHQPHLQALYSRIGGSPPPAVR